VVGRCAFPGERCDPAPRRTVISPPTLWIKRVSASERSLNRESGQRQRLRRGTAIAERAISGKPSRQRSSHREELGRTAIKWIPEARALGSGWFPWSGAFLGREGGRVRALAEEALSAGTRQAARPSGAEFPLMLLPIALGAALGLSLALVAFALTPRRAMRRSRADFVQDRRDALLWAGLAAALGIGIGVAIAFGLS
jgi:hypothetical protein